jgi:GNAT superfamily N-acetyltransferase
MGAPISIRLDDNVRTELEAQARARGVGLATLLRELANEAAREAWRARVRAESEAVGARVASSDEARAFYEDWGTPDWDVLDSDAE